VVSYLFSQEEGNVDQGSSIRWFVKRSGSSSYVNYAAYDNRNVQRSSEVTALDPSGPFQEGDLWYIEVTPRDVNSTGVMERSNIIRIGLKIPPYITSATIAAATGDPALTTDSSPEHNLIAQPQDLVADYAYVDPNLVGDQTLSDASVIQWFRGKDGTPAYTGSSADKVLLKSHVRAGDAWSYVVTPFDGLNHGDGYTSVEVTITQESEATTPTTPMVP